MAVDVPGAPVVHSRRQAAYDQSRRGDWVASPVSSDNVTPPAPSKSNEELPRAASYTYLPTAKDLHYGDPTLVEIKGFPASEYVPHNAADVDDVSPPDSSTPNSSGYTTPEEHAPASAPPEVKDIVAHLRNSASTTRDDQLDHHSLSRVESSTRQSRISFDSTNTASTAITAPLPREDRPSINKSFSRRFSRQSWYQSNNSSPSRSPSPQKEAAVISDYVGLEKHEQDTRNDGRRKSLLTRTLTGKSLGKGKAQKDGRKSIEEQEPEKPEEPEKPVKRKGTILRKKAARASAGTNKVATYDGPVTHSPVAKDAPPIPTLPKSFSTDRLPTLRTDSLNVTDRAAPVPRLVSSHDMRLKSHSPLAMTKKKDELWSVFRSLDADFVKFSSKSSSLKANVVRNSLIPFLRSYAVLPTHKLLRPEDLDRRTNILNKWWTGLIELLHGRNNQSISGTDRPVILDGISGIMERPEWRLAPSQFCPLIDRIGATLSNGSRSNTSLGSSSSDFLADSVYHNVRNIFVQNLSAQMAFVVDKMSLRNASASLVTFCGKACAYAFMFVPGMADILSRLWDLPMDLLRRVLQENRIGKFDQMSKSAGDIVADFPLAVQQLGFTTSLMKYVRRLRTPPPLPLGTNHIHWWGHWLERWTGRESDLFYVFVKYYHILATDFLPSHCTREERMSAPGMLLVHSQILTNLDATIHRDANQAAHDATTVGHNATFDDLFTEPDAIASPLPLPPTNSLRLMAENRLVMLIRDFLSERTADHPIARELFAQSFNDLLQCAVRGTSMYEHSACYTLLDLLEEALVIMIRYEMYRESEEPLMDSEFWQEVCKKMIDSENTMTEIRLYSFLYTIWNFVVSDPQRKLNLCMDLVLDRDVFESRFNHWCPMVRAYYMRLLCWRVARHDGDYSDDEFRIYETMHHRLQETWSHYLHLHSKAVGERGLLPDTSPCHPAPGRRLIVVRTDNQVNTGPSFKTFDGLLKDVPSGIQRPSQILASSTPTLLDGMDSRPESSCSSTVDSESDSREKGIGGFLRKMIGGSKTRSKSQGPTKRTPLPPPAAPVPEKLPAGLFRSATDEPKTGRSASFAETAPDGKPPTTRPQPQHRSLSFKFSLEFQSNNKQFPPMRLCPPRLPHPAQMFLQANTKTPLINGEPVAPRGESIARARYAGRALAEWTVVVGECHSFFERRKNEGAPGNRFVETPTLGVEVFKRPS